VRKVLTAALLGVGILAGGSLTAAPPAAAQSVGVEVNPGGGIAFGYTDGYWDQGHHWHAWRNANEAAQWREEHRDHYYAYKHDRDHDEGWRANDTWWHH